MKKYLILSKSKYEMKLALLEDNKLDEMYIERNNQKEITGNIYKGKVVDILNNGELVFVDIGLKKNALLSFENKKIIPKLNIDDKLIVQIETEPRDEKGAKLTLDYSINGENLVLLPKSKNLSISKKIKDIEEVNRLKNIFFNIDNGLILRTNSKGKSEERLIKVLLEEIGKKDLIKRLRKYFKDEEIFEYYNINSQIERALDRKVYLDSGAYIIIEKTEALISIDVNTGQNTGNKTSQELIFQTNLEATKEIARQIL